jgi:hypothetical protein
MTFDLPEFVEEMARAGAAAEHTDLATYIMLLIIRDEERRLADAARAAADAALPVVSEEVRCPSTAGAEARSGRPLRGTS